MDYNTMAADLMARANPFQRQRMQGATPEQTAMAQQRWGAANPEQQAAFMQQAQARLAEPEKPEVDPVQAEMQRLTAMGHRHPNPFMAQRGQASPFANFYAQRAAPTMVQGGGGGNYMELLGKRR
jgi:hypothetical protein